MKNHKPTKSINLKPILIRSVVVKAIRDFFAEKDFTEVITPTFNVALPLEPNIYAFETTWSRQQQDQKLYLSTSPESGLKKMLAQEVGNCFAIGKCFRNMEGAGHRHNPEFLMLEWYREDADYWQIMKDTEELLRFVKTRVDEYVDRPKDSKLEYQDQVFDLGKDWSVFSLEKLFALHAKVRFADVLSDEALQKIARERGYQTHEATWSQLFDQIFLNEVEPHLPDLPLFLIDFPAKLSPLCKTNPEKPYLAERFEFYLGGMEIGNGNNEHTDVEKVAASFAAEQHTRKTASQPTPPVDTEFLAALEKMANSKKSYAGIGLGVDRLAMLMANTPQIEDVEYFCIR